VIKGTEFGLRHMGKDVGGDGGVIINTASMAGEHYTHFTSNCPVEIGM
jgi:NAD(P)-dependent dehydrogenase (short-subunit alcohol dehydrogenase family)